MRSRGYAATHIGRRENNEDAYRVDSALGLYTVADGMGGYEGGEIASRISVDTLHDYFRRLGEGTDPGFDIRYDDTLTVAESVMSLAMRMADREVRRRKHGALAQMGSTVAAFMLRRRHVMIAHVGDSRIYRMRDGRLEQLTRDHSLYYELLKAGTVDVHAPHKLVRTNVITRAIGVAGHAQPDVKTVEATPGDTFLLCTDGLSDVLGNAEIAAALGTLEPYDAVDALVHQAYVAGSQDNITAIVVRVE